MRGLKLVGALLCVMLLAGSDGSAAAEAVEQSATRCTNADTAYDPYCDVDGSGDITVEDISLVALHWNTSGDPTLSAIDAWNLSGNAGTDPSTNFLGTTDGQPLVIKTNGVEAVRLDTAGNVGIGTDSPQERLHVVGDLRLDSTLICTGCVVTDTLASGVVTLAKLATGSVDAGKIVDGSVGAADVDTAEVQRRVAGTCGSGSAIRTVNEDGTVTCESVSGGGGGGWALTGNAGTTPGTNYLGTSDSVAFQIHVNGERALRVEPASDAFVGFSPNVIGGYSGNGLVAGVLGATIGGGGRSGSTNQVTADFGTVGGGEANAARNRSATVGGGNDNTASGEYATVSGGSNNRAGGQFATVGGGIANEASGGQATVPGGLSNTAAGDYSFAAGRSAKADHDGAFVWADSTGTALHSSANNQFTARAAGGVRFYSNAAASAGVTLAPGSGSWASASDRNLKTDLRAVDASDVLARLAGMPITTWSYREQDPSVRHIGPTAQDFYAAFGLGEDAKHINTVDADGVALAAIQGLYEIVQAQQAQLAELQQHNAELRARLAALERAIQSD